MTVKYGPRIIQALSKRIKYNVRRDRYTCSTSYYSSLEENKLEGSKPSRRDRYTGSMYYLRSLEENNISSMRGRYTTNLLSKFSRREQHNVLIKFSRREQIIM